MNFRKLHRQAAPIIFLPLLLAALTGLAYRVGKKFDIPSEMSRYFMVLHQGEFLGGPLVPLYVIFMGLGLIGMIITGLSLVFSQKTPLGQPRRDNRWTHRILSILGFLPLAVSALTGIAYAVGTRWLHLSSRDIGFLMRLHQGSVLGSTLGALYLLSLGVGLIALLVTGIRMTPLFRQRRSTSGS